MSSKKSQGRGSKSFRESRSGPRDLLGCLPNNARRFVMPYPCSLCSESFYYPDYLEYHMLTTHYGGEDRNTGMEAAPRMHHQRNPQMHMYQCNECQASFSRADDLEIHKLTTHYQERASLLPPCGEFSFAIVPVPTDLVTSPERIGRFRGIQGENNSCYLDASLMALFYAHDTFDSLLQSPMNHESSLSFSPVEYARTYMTLHIVNNLRTRGFVPSMLVFEWRRMIASWFGSSRNFDTHCQEEEACELVRFLMETFGDDSLRLVAEAAGDRKLPSTVQVNADTATEASKGEVMLQLLTPSYQNPVHAGAWTTEQLLNDTMSAEKLAFTELGGCLILQLPRYGKRDRVIGAVVPSPTLCACTLNGKKVRYELSSMLVIGTSHFVTYLRVSKQQGSKPKWLYYDSMSDRISEQNIPLIEDVTDQMEILGCENASTHVQSEMVQPGREHLRRVVEDLSIVIYRRVEQSEVGATESNSGSIRGSLTPHGSVDIDSSSNCCEVKLLE